MFDFKDFYEGMAMEMPKKCMLVEVGIANGDSALYLAKKLKEWDKDFKLYMVDNMDYGKYEQMKTIYENIFKIGLYECVEVMPYDSIEASKMFNDNSLDFAFLDSSHLYEPTKREIVAWYSKMKDDKILAGHDYFGHEQVKKAVDELLPKTITREPIDKPDQYQAFEQENFLHTIDTDNHYGIWYIRKRFYFKP